MILLTAALLAAAPPPAPHAAKFGAMQARFDDCVKQSDADPAAAEKVAIAWARTGGGIAAAQCIGIARSAAGKWVGAASAFTTGADLAEKTHQPVIAANLWVSAGDAALAGGDPASAREALSRAIASPDLPDPLKGEAYLDRARATVAAGDNAAARTDIDAALKLVPADPMAWLLSATLARRTGDIARAASDIKEAAIRAPNQSDILYEAGNIAATGGNIAGAREQWSRAAAAEPESDAAARARAELADTAPGAPAKP